MPYVKFGLISDPICGEEGGSTTELFCAVGQRFRINVKIFEIVSIAEESKEHFTIDHYVKQNQHTTVCIK